MAAMRDAREAGMHEELRGGGICPAGGRCGLLVVDLDQHPNAAVRLSTREAEALRVACAQVAALAVVTCGSGVDVRRALARAGIGVTSDAPRLAVLSDEPCAHTSPGTTDRAAAFVRLCQRLRIPLASTIVIATSEADLAPLLEAGHALAIADGGAACCAAADARFPARAAGGLADALNAAARLAARELTR